MRRTDYHNTLDRPPRRVSFLVRMQLFIGGLSTQSGFAFAGFGLIFVWFFGGADLLVSVVHFSGELTTTQGKVTRVEVTSEGGDPHDRGGGDTKVFTYHYTFGVDGSRHTGRTKTYVNKYHTGATAAVEYPVGNPARSRIQGPVFVRSWVGTGTAMLFVIVGLGGLLFGLQEGLRGCRLLGRGKVAVGKMLSRERTDKKEKNRHVYKFVFGFEADDGEHYKVTTKTSEPRLLDGEDGLDDDDDDGPSVRESLLYNPSNPSDVAMLDALPGQPRVDDTGRIRLKNPWRLLLSLITPGAF